jgi:hypothetical protein
LIQHVWPVASHTQGSSVQLETGNTSQDEAAPPSDDAVSKSSPHAPVVMSASPIQASRMRRRS